MSQLKRVIWTDDDGYKRAVLLPLSCPDNQTELGIPSEPPLIDQLDWMAIKRDLHNALVDAGLLNWNDIQAGQGKVNIICRRVLGRRVLELFRRTEVLPNE